MEKSFSIVTNAIMWATKAHSGQYDPEGNLYIHHPLWVMEQVRKLGYNDHVQAAAVGHDVFEDCIKESPHTARAAGISERAIEIMLALKHEAGAPYTPYIDSILETGDEEVIVVKAVDMFHNLKRNPSLMIRDPERAVRMMTKKYAPNFPRLIGALPESTRMLMAAA